MSPIAIEVFSEGKTENGIREQLCVRGICPYDLVERGGGGERDMLRKLDLRLRDWSSLSEEKRDPLRILVLRDWDSGRTLAGLRDSVSSIVRQYCTDAALTQHLSYDNVFTFQSGISGLRLALHIATYRYHEQFIKSTIDDYVLDLALRTTTVQALLQRYCQGWIITADQLTKIVRDEIPELLRSNGISSLVEAKNYVRFYAAVLQAHTSPSVFAQITLANAKEDDVRAVFAPLLAAVQSLGEDQL